MEHGANRRPRQPQFVERIEAEQPGTVNRIPDDRMFLQEDDGVPLGRQAACRYETGRPSPDHHDVPALPRQNFRSLSSHVPRRVIQNESATNRISRPNDRRLT